MGLELQESPFVELVNQLIRDEEDNCTPENDYQHDITFNSKKYLLDDNTAKVLHEIKKLKISCFGGLC